MLQACKFCSKQYNNLKERSDCPHEEFLKMCIKHYRYNCGNIECTRGKLLNLRKGREEVA